MKKSNPKFKLTAIISLMSLSLITITLLAGCVASDDKNASSLPSSSDTSSTVTETSSITVPDIPFESISSEQFISSLPSITVDGSPSSTVSSTPSASSSKPSENGSGSSISSKASNPPKVSSAPSVSSQASSGASKPTNDPNNPVDGTTKVEDGKGYIFIEGKWWEDNSYGQQTVDDSDRVFGACPDCGLIDCICKVGY